MQVTALTPAVGTRSYEANFEKGLVFDSVGNRPVLQYQFDGNHVVASASCESWRAQLNVLLAYASHYNPINLARTLLRPSNSLYLAGLYDQIMGMIGLVPTAINSAKWSYRLWRGPVTRRSCPPGPKTPLIDVSPVREAHADSTSQAVFRPELVQLCVG